MGEVAQALSWVDTMLVTPQHERELWVEQIADGLKGNAASFTYPNVDPKAIKKTADDLAALVKTIFSKDFEIIGFVPNINYIRVHGSKSFLNAWWVHPFSSPTLAVKHKKLPVIMLVGASILKDKSNIFELPPDSDQIFSNQVIGIT